MNLTIVGLLTVNEPCNLPICELPPMEIVQS